MKNQKLSFKVAERISVVEKLEPCFSYNLHELHEMLQVIQELYQADQVFLSVIDSEQQKFIVSHQIEDDFLAAPQSLCASEIMSESVYHFFSQISDWEKQTGTHFYKKNHITNLYSVRICDSKTNLAIGTLGIGFKGLTAFSDRQIELLSVFKNQIEKNIYTRMQFNQLISTKVQFKESQDIKEKFLDCSKLGSWDWNLTTDEIRYDSRWANLVGVDVTELNQNVNDWASRVHPDDKQRVLEDIQKCLSGQTSSYENTHRLKHANGDWIWTLDRGVVFERDENKKAVRFLGTQLDITKYINNDFFSSEIQKAAHIGGWQFDFVQQKFKFTDQVYAILNIDPQNENLSMEAFLNFFPDEERQRIFMSFLKNQECQSFEGVYQIKTSTGQKKILEIVGHPIENSFDFVSKSIGVIQDITDKYEAEKAIEESRVRATMASKMASLGELSAGVAHEINNPLAILMGTVNSLEIFFNDKDKLKNKVETMNKAIHRIAKIVKGLGKFSRSAENTEMIFVCLSDIVAEAIVMTEIKAKKLDVKIQTSLNSKEQVYCNPLEIEQVVINLVNNAIDAAHASPDKTVLVNVFDQNQCAVLQVIDSGMGISSDVEEKIFNPFFTTKPLGEGTGLGLSICKGIVESHKGDIGINKNFQQTCFEVKIPLDVTDVKSA